MKKEFPDANLKIYEDRDRSGYTFSQRENYQKMRKELMEGEVHILIVKDFSRFSRRNSLGLLELETLRDAGVRIISIGDSIDYPTRDDWMLIQFKFLMNEMPVTDTSKKIKQMIDNRQKNGQWICAVPYGYRITNTKEMTYEIDPQAAEIVREVFRLYNNGWGYKKIANHLTDIGVPTPRTNEIAAKEAEGKATKLKARNEWSIITVQHILSNDFYIGTLRQRKYTRTKINGKDTYVMVIDQYQARDLINDEKWLAAQQHANIRGETNPIFSGALGVYEGVVLHQHNRVLRTETGSGGTTVGHALFLGAQAAVFAMGEGPYWYEDFFDYGNKFGVSFGKIFGIKKTAFKYDGENLTDFGCINVLTASEKD